MNLYKKIVRNNFGDKTPLLEDEKGNIVQEKLPDELVGEMTDKKCPKCGANLLKNLKGDEWCSFVECSFEIDSV
ncbi:MAG: hypothetical protein ACTSYW_00610 [Candidatus Heimdallarchaeota archaeon]